MVTERLKTLRRTKFYDLIVAAPMIAWFMFSVAQMLPPRTQRVTLMMLFVRTDPSVLPVTLVLRAVSETITLAFFVLLGVMFAVRYIPQRGALGFWLCFVVVVCFFFCFGFVLLLFLVF